VEKLQNARQCLFGNRINYTQNICRIYKQEQMKINNLNYHKKLEMGFIAALLILTVLMYIFPKFYAFSRELPAIKAPQIIVIEIPRTIQINVKRPPRPSKPAIPVPVDEIEILEDIEIDFETMSDILSSEKIFSSEELEGLPYIPRQILEVLPEQGEEKYSGEILLSLRIGKKGRVKEHKILKNTTNSPLCLKNVITAAYNSKWQPVIIDSNIYEYWIQKSYHFN